MSNSSDRGHDRGTLWALALLALLFLQGLLFITTSSQTSDEAAHLLAGYTYLTTGDFRMDREEPPLVKELAAFPLLFLGLERPEVAPEKGMGAFRLGPAFVHENRVSGDTILLLARLPILGLSLLLGWSIYRWGTTLFGRPGALAALALYVLDPNVVAHSGLVTTDLGVTLFIFLALYALWAWSRRPSPRTLVASGLALGAAFASKFTAIWSLPVLAVLGLALTLGGTPLPKHPWTAEPVPASGGGRWRDRLVPLALAALTVAAVAAVVVLVACGGSGLPEYVAGLGRGLGHSTSGHTAYLLGEVSQRGWWYYFLLAFVWKTPPGTLVIVALAIVAAFRGWRLPARDEIVLWVPILAIATITSLWRVNIGLRHLLPLYPFLFLFAGRVAARRPGFDRLGWAGWILRGAAVACLFWNGIEAATITPYQLAYFNRLAGGPANGHLYLLDSNLDWGQSSKALRRFQEAARAPVIYCAFTGGSDPRYDGVRYQYVTGIGNFEDAARRTLLLPDDSPAEYLAIGATTLHFAPLDGGTFYDWLRDRPVVATPGYSFLVYDITGDADAHLRLARLYLASRLPVLASVEARRALRIEPGLRAAGEILERLAR